MHLWTTELTKGQHKMEHLHQEGKDLKENLLTLETRYFMQYIWFHRNSLVSYNIIYFGNSGNYLRSSFTEITGANKTRGFIGMRKCDCVQEIHFRSLKAMSSKDNGIHCSITQRTVLYKLVSVRKTEFVNWHNKSSLISCRLGTIPRGWKKEQFAWFAPVGSVVFFFHCHGLELPHDANNKMQINFSELYYLF